MVCFTLSSEPSEAVTVPLTIGSNNPRRYRVGHQIRHRRRRHFEPRGPTTGWHAVDIGCTTGLCPSSQGSHPDCGGWGYPTRLGYLQGSGIGGQLLFYRKDPILGVGCTCLLLFFSVCLLFYLRLTKYSITDKRALNWRFGSSAKNCGSPWHWLGK